MSLINDALKRAKQTHQQKAPPPTAAPGTPLRPVETSRRPAPANSLLLPLLLAAGLVLVGGAVILFALNKGTARDSTGADSTPAPAVSTSPNAAPVAPPIQAPAPVATPPVVAPATTVATNAPPPAASPVIVTQTVIVVESAKPPPPKVEPPPPLPKLQGILFNPARPTAFLNGKSVLVGGKVGEFTVVAITQQAVTIERAGQTNVLTMPD